MSVDKQKLLQTSNIIVLSLLIILMILPRIGVYLLKIQENVYADAAVRYLPQAEKLDESLKYFYQQTGPLYSLLLLIFQKIFHEAVKSTVFFQHLLGIVTGIIFYLYLKRFSSILAFIIVTIVFCGPRALALEHTVLRESLVSFLVILFIILISSFIKNVPSKSAFKYAFGSGLTGFLLFSLRVEYIVVYFFVPLFVFFIIFIKRAPKGVEKKIMLLSASAFFLPLIIYILIWLLMSSSLKVETTYGGFFNIAYHALQPDVYYYNGSSYPELLKLYQQDMEWAKSKTGSSKCTYRDSPETTSLMMGAHYETTKKYLSEHPEIRLTFLQLMDKIFLEMMLKNTRVFIKSILINSKYILLTECAPGQDSVLILPKNDFQKRAIQKTFYFLTLPNRINPLAVNKYLFLLFFLSIPVFIIGVKIIPPEAFLIFFVVFTQLIIYALFSTATPRFRFALDPFIYFLQLYAAWMVLHQLAKKSKRLIKSWTKS